MTGSALLACSRVGIVTLTGDWMIMADQKMTEEAEPFVAVMPLTELQ